LVLEKLVLYSGTPAFFFNILTFVFNLKLTLKNELSKMLKNTFNILTFVFLNYILG